MKRSVWSMVIGLLFLVGCGEKRSASNTPVSSVDLAVQTGQLDTSISESALITSAIESIEGLKGFLLEAKLQLFNLNPDGSARDDGKSLTSIQWDPTHDAALITPTLGENTAILLTNAVTSSAYKVDKQAVAVIGQKASARYLVLGSSPFRKDLSSTTHPQMTQFMLNTIAWLVGRDDFTTRPLNIVLAHLDDSGYFRDESKTRAWLDQQYGDKVNYTATENSCDGAALKGCLLSNTDLLVISQVMAAEESTAEIITEITAAVNQALSQGISVLYLHHNGDLKPLGAALFSDVFDVQYYGDNDWRKLSLVDYNPIDDLKQLPPSLLSIQTALKHLREADYQFDWSQCEGENCSNVTGLAESFTQGAEATRAIMMALDLGKKDIFQESGYRVQKLLALVGDKLRQSVVYPMDKITTDDTLFLKSYFADHAVYNFRTTNPVQPDMGNFSRSNFSHITPITKEVSLISKRNFRSTGVYALPGQTVRITRKDSSALTVKVFINTLRAGATHTFANAGYTRPKYLKTPEIEIKPNETLTLTSPYGGPIQLAFSQNELPVRMVFHNVGEHPYWRDSQDDASFAQKLIAAEYDWAEVATNGFEVHSKLEKMKTSITDVKWGSAQALANATAQYMSNYPHVLAGFKGEGIDVVDEIHQFATQKGLTLNTIDTVKHMNADQATCGYGCSGNPYDAYWSYSPIGHGDVHELGHGLEKARLRFEGWEVHASTNPYSYYTKSRYHQTTGGDPDCQNLPFKAVFDQLQASKKAPDPVAYLKANLWASSGWSQQFMVTLQAMMHAQKQGALKNGWHLLARLHILERAVPNIANSTDWDNQKANFGFGLYSLEDYKTMRANDWLLIAFSFAAGLDYRDYLTMMGIEYSDKASSQVAAFGYNKVPSTYFVSTANGYCKIDGYGSYLDKTLLPVDGQSVWPE